MGSEDLFHKRKARSNLESERKKAKRQQYDKILIVCEGEKTEPIYFDEIRVYYELDSANVEIDGRCDSSPISVVEYAYKEYLSSKAQCDPYDRVFCVFDKDAHSTYSDALTRLDAINSEIEKAEPRLNNVFTPITSVPCFEFWLLLHFNPTTRPFSSAGNKSAGARLIDELKAYIPNYKKSQKGLFLKSIEMGTLDFARENSRRIYDDSVRLGNDNPSTKIHNLVDVLINLKGNVTN